MPVVPSIKGGPTWPFAPGMPGITWQTAQPACVNRSINGSSPVANGTLSGVTDSSRALFGVIRGEGARRAQITDRQTNAIAVHTTAGFGDRDPGFDVDDSDRLGDIVWSLRQKIIQLLRIAQFTKAYR